MRFTWNVSHLPPKCCFLPTVHPLPSSPFPLFPSFLLSFSPSCLLSFFPFFLLSFCFFFTFLSFVLFYTLTFSILLVVFSSFFIAFRPCPFFPYPFLHLFLYCTFFSSPYFMFDLLALSSEPIKSVSSSVRRCPLSHPYFSAKV